MTKINVFKTSRLFPNLFIIAGSIFAIIGILLFIKFLSDGFDTHFPSGEWNSVIFIIQGLLFIVMGVGNIAVKKYFIQWDENELQFLLPGSGKVDSVKLTDIVTVNIKLFEIELILRDNKKVLDLSNLQFEDLKKIKEKFEPINKRSQ